MHAVRFVVVKLKNLFLPMLITCFTVFLIVFSSTNLQAAQARLTFVC